MKVTFVHAVCAKIGPTIAFPNNNAMASPPITVNPGCAAWALQPFAVGSHQCEANAAQFDFQPKISPITMTPKSAAVLVTVKLFCTIFPTRSPRVFKKVRNAINRIATSCSVERLRAYPGKTVIGATK